MVGVKSVALHRGAWWYSRGVRRLSVMVPLSDWQAIVSHARANDRTIAAEVRRMVRMYVQMIRRQDAGEPPASAA